MRAPSAACTLCGQTALVIVGAASRRELPAFDRAVEQSQGLAARRRSHASSLLSAAERVHDLDPVSCLQTLRGVRSAGHDLAVHFDGDPTFGQTFDAQQIGQGTVRVDDPALAVQLDFHARILPHRPGYDATQRERGQAK